MTSPPTSTRSWVLANYPKGNPILSSSDENATFKLVDRALPALKPNQVLVKSLYLSNDPAQRGWIESSIPVERMYTKPVALDEPMHAYGLGEVIASTAEGLPTGTIIQGSLGWSEYRVLDEAECSIRTALPNGLSLTHYLGAFGGPGLTAYYGLVVVGGAQRGMKVVVSGAAGATGSMVVQIAKNVSPIQSPLNPEPESPLSGPLLTTYSRPFRSSAALKSLALQAPTTSAAGSKAWVPTNVSTTAARRLRTTSPKPPRDLWTFTTTTLV